MISRCDDTIAWVRARLGSECFAPFTGQDWVAFKAWTHLLELYFLSDGNGRHHAINAMRSALLAMQAKCWPVAKTSIPAIGDWSHEEEIWDKINLEAT